MTVTDKLNEYQKAPVKTADGRLWAQQCYICGKLIDFIKDPSAYKWMRVVELVRHRKCYPEVIR